MAANANTQAAGPIIFGDRSREEETTTEKLVFSLGDMLKDRPMRIIVGHVKRRRALPVHFTVLYCTALSECDSN